MKTVTWPDAFGYTIFCDDIRTENNNKNILIGVYNSEIILTSPFPTTLMKLVMEVHYAEKPSSSELPVVLNIYLPGDLEEAPSIVSEIGSDFRKIDLPDVDDPRCGFILAIALSPVEFKQEGQVKVRVTRGDEVIRIGAIMVRSVADAPAT
ncbi:hypothetical protein QO010_004249 [Caulobacter ginsengisoli]|uniref:Uncharacterized protein n=1 Tax=Caulobacter ginsengisoli TaxID=400775 RepID=A0ABU0IYR0_9CAUL|nr:hypothetical protein [Caulobacter ginsengisoli]MDQ0466456.1 hypothetical protein [Caulobacter ginsengisoli]